MIEFVTAAKHCVCRYVYHLTLGSASEDKSIWYWDGRQSSWDTDDRVCWNWRIEFVTTARKSVCNVYYLTLGNATHYKSVWSWDGRQSLWELDDRVRDSSPQRWSFWLLKMQRKTRACGHGMVGRVRGIQMTESVTAAHNGVCRHVDHLSLGNATHTKSILSCYGR